MNFFFLVDVVRQGTGRTSQNALHGIAGKITGLITGLNKRNSDAKSLVQITQFDCFDRAHLNALAAFDASGDSVAGETQESTFLTDNARTS